MFKRTKKGQTSMEFLVLMTVILAAFLSISNYFKRGLQGRWKSTVDELGEQYDPRTGNTMVVHRIISNTDTQIIALNTSEGWWTSRRDMTNVVETKSGYVSSGAY
ncbi:MAG: class III signal peptide-containing protein [Candidatus Micrarchaeota archaeon]